MARRYPRSFFRFFCGCLAREMMLALAGSGQMRVRFSHLALAVKAASPLVGSTRTRVPRTALPGLSATPTLTASPLRSTAAFQGETSTCCPPTSNVTARRCQGRHPKDTSEKERERACLCVCVCVEQHPTLANVRDDARNYGWPSYYRRAYGRCGT